MAPAGDAKLLRTLPSGVKLMVRETASNNSWRRPNLSLNEYYFSDVVGNRVEAVADEQVKAIERKTGKKVDRAVIEYGAH